MSDAESVRKDEGDTPASPSNPWVSWLIWLILAPVLYVLSSGPVFWLVHKHHLPEQLGFIYLPLVILDGGPDRLLQSYWRLWVP